jgi:CubicO group peptidase (beta-lactamase class C family)
VIAPYLRARPEGRIAAACLLTAAMLVGMNASPAMAAERNLPDARPEQVGMSGERLQRISELTRRYVDQGKLAGAVTLVARKGKVVYFDAVGQADLQNGAPMREDTLFRIYSMSKPITSVAMMMLYEEGAFQLSDPISNFLPELADLEVLQEDGSRVPAEPITMQQLLTHTAGLSYGFNPRDPVDVLYRESNWAESRDLDDFIARLAGLPLKFQPGSRWHYSVANDVQGAIVERISGQRFDVFLKERLFEPLGMHDTFFDVPADKLDRLGTNHSFNAETGQLEVLPVPGYPVLQGTTFFSGGHDSAHAVALATAQRAEVADLSGPHPSERRLSSPSMAWKICARMAGDSLTRWCRASGM